MKRLRLVGVLMVGIAASGMGCCGYGEVSSFQSCGPCLGSYRGAKSGFTPAGYRMSFDNGCELSGRR